MLGGAQARQDRGEHVRSEQDPHELCVDRVDGVPESDRFEVTT
jgi:hypothetical protein